MSYVNTHTHTPLACVSFVCLFIRLLDESCSWSGNLLRKMASLAQQIAILLWTINRLKVGNKYVARLKETVYQSRQSSALN